jgi:hypothetical protein
MELGTALTCLEPKATAKAKLGVNGQWINVQDPAGDQGYVAAWYVSENKDAPAAAPAAPATAASASTTVASKPAAAASAPAKPIPPGSLVFLPTEELSFRSRPEVAPDSLIRRIPVTEQLVCIEPANFAIPKVGVTNQWLKVRDQQNKEGFVAAWYVKYASGSQPPKAGAPATPPPPAPGGVLKVKAVAEGIALRKQPVVSDATLIRRLPLGTEFTVTEPNAEGKVGKNDQWLKAKDPSGTEGYIAAWFVSR